jgi:uncharacterized protein
MTVNTETELNADFVNSLAVDENKILRQIAAELTINQNQVGVTIGLFNEGNTVPFIARYRKEKTGSLDEIQVRNIEQRLQSLRNLETRKLEIIRSVFSQGLLDHSIYTNIMKSATLTELEELYAPYKKKKKTRAMLAIEKGLEKLANMMVLLSDPDIEKAADTFINPEKGVKDREEALNGAMDIIAERVALDVDTRKKVREHLYSQAKMVVQGNAEEEKSVYKTYYNYSEYIKNLKSHQILAINRGEKEEELKVKTEFDTDAVAGLVQSQYRINNRYYRQAVDDGLKRLLLPSVLRELKTEQTKSAEKHGIEIFARNLKNLLMQPPIKRTRVLGMDPGIRTGTKCAVIDENGKYLSYFVIFQQNGEKAKKTIEEQVRQFKVQLIAIGNGTGSHEVQTLVAEAISDYKLDIQYTVVPEDGASVYSASETASEEFPDLDLTIRGAISIGRRLQDPLAELVKIDPKSIGVGLYQHDVNQKELSESVDHVVESVVNQVGVNLNTASAPLLKYISGISATVARNIVKYREEKGLIKSRSDLKAVPGIGAKVFEQAAGFLMIPESNNFLDNTWIHPENYKIGKEIAEIIKKEGRLGNEQREKIKSTYAIGDTTIDDISETLKKPGRDPREDYPMPILQKGVINFADLKVDMMVTGKVKNVVDFGAFIDIGIKETALLHVSQMSNKFIKNPMDVVKVGDVLNLRIIQIDEIRKRVSLSLKSKS